MYTGGHQAVGKGNFWKGKAMKTEVAYLAMDLNSNLYYKLFPIILLLTEN